MLGLALYRPLSYTCAALTCRPPEERAVRRSTATTRRPRSACSGASRPTSTVRAHISHHLPCAPTPASLTRRDLALSPLSGSWCKCRGCDGCKQRTTTRSLLPPPPPQLARSAPPLKGSGGAGGGRSGGGGGGGGAGSGGGSDGGGIGSGSGPRQADPETQRLLQVCQTTHPPNPDTSPAHTSP